MGDGDGDVDVIVEAVQDLFDSLKNPSFSLGLYRTFIDFVPSGLRDLSPTSFNPRVVSIGPLHKDEQHLQAFDEQKVKYAHKLLYSPDSLPNQMLKECVEKVVAKTDRIRACYDKIKMENYNDTELAKMMVIDACFILEYLGRPEFKVENRSYWRGQSIVYDLVLVENQIPFFILQDIFDSTILKSEPTASLTSLLLPLVQICNIFETKSITANITPRLNFQDHILGFLENCYHPSRNNSPSEGLPSSPIHSTVELNRAGVIFKPNNRDETWPMAMEFKSSPLACFSWCWGKPTLRIPVLLIDNFTELFLRNLIAYEHASSSYKTHGYVTSYAMAMDMLVDTQEDVAILINSKVLVNHLGSNEKAADMINSLCKQQPIRMFCYVHQWQEMDTHYNSYWPKNIAALKRTYFSSPWSMITLLGGFALFVLTVVQTIYAVRAR